MCEQKKRRVKPVASFVGKQSKKDTKTLKSLGTAKDAISTATQDFVRGDWMGVSVRKFVSWKAGEQINIDNPKAWLQERYSSRYLFGLDILMRRGCYQLHGWEYDLRPWLKNYVYKQHENWHEAWAPNKTLLKKVVYGKINKIVEVV